MAKTYRTATKEDIAKGKGKSTDELSLAEATAYFNKRATETGAKKFRYKGEVYDLSGNKSTVEMIKPKATAKTATSEKPKATAKTAPEKTMNTVRPEVSQKPKAAPKSYSGRGGDASEVSRRATDAKATAARKAKEDMQDKTKKVVAGAVAAGTAALGARAALSGGAKIPRKPATPTVTNPTYNPRSGMKTGFQGKMETGVGRPGSYTKAGGRGLSGNPAPYEQLTGRGGRVSSMDGKDDKLPLFSKGGMVKKGKK